MEDTGRANHSNDDGTVGLGGDTDIPIDETKKAMVQKPGALKIYDGALGDEFADELIELFNLNVDLHENQKSDNLEYIDYNYTENHKDEDVHKKLMEHTGQLYKHYLKDLGTPNMINVSGFEEIKIQKFEKGVGYHDLHLGAVNHESAIRAVHFTWFLNETDGNIDYPLQRIGIQPKKGRVVITPVSWEYPSKNYISKKSDKFMLETFLHYA